ncbi:hypothetical protein [Pseudomonas lurida]|uniref:Uncharacterized protein n=1 Tax=Pseudomonas lurida TaxID=244566 RepID=A0ABY9FSI0_9PSED|nr:hypothetical protein [Pseudomonas lurida]WLH06302.1 hypothetical protein PSH67_26335 [Pseudomonas lurida]
MSVGFLQGIQKDAQFIQSASRRVYGHGIAVDRSTITLALC